jgi:hypothetical protein
MSRLIIDLVGRTYGRWRVLALRPERSRYGDTIWDCRCICGEERGVTGGSLRSGNSTSCGCVGRENLRKRNTKHGHARRGHVTRAYMRWQAMLRRCFNPNAKEYCNYGGRDDAPITVCERWLTFENYFADTGDVPPGLTIGRINNDGDYQPNNVRRESYVEQARNRRVPKQKKRRRATLAEISAYTARLARAASALDDPEAAP